MATLGDMQARIADEIMRSDLSSQIALCITDAIGIYQIKRFKFSDLQFTMTFNIGQNYYSVSDNANIPNLYIIDFIAMQIGNTWQKIRETTPETIQLLTQTGTMMGPPEVFAYFEEELQFYPVPNLNYNFVIFGNVLVPAPVTTSQTGNPWMLDAERLIRSRAKYELAVHYTHDAEMALAMSPAEPALGALPGATYEAYEILKSETNLITGTGMLIPTQF
jgi:hypothetical protein